MSFKIFQKNPKWLQNLTKDYEKMPDIVLGFPVGSDGVGAAYPDGTAVLEVAFFNEFGTIRIPARPFLKSGTRIARKKLQEEIEDVIKMINAGEDPTQALNFIGEVAAGIIKQVITKLKSPPNSASTIAKKGSANPLIDTGLMRQLVTYQVRVR